MANSEADCGHCYACIECMSQQLLTLNKCATCMSSLNEKRPFIVMFHPRSATATSVAKGKKQKIKTPSAQESDGIIEIDSGSEDD